MGEGREVIHEFNGDYIQWVLYFSAHRAWLRSHTLPSTFITSSLLPPILLLLPLSSLSPWSYVVPAEFRY